MDVTFYDANGRSIAYMEDDEHIYLFTGEPVAYIHGGSIYDFNGRHKGWLSDGWIRDSNGYAALFTDNAFGGPMKPMRQMRPMKSMRQMRQMKVLRTMAPMRPMDVLGWSPRSGEEFFK